MAITAAALNTALGGRVTDPRVMQELPPYGGANQYWQVKDGMDRKGRVKKLKTTAADDAATQATAVIAVLADGPTAPAGAST